MNRGIAGSLESCDALITVKRSDKTSVTVKSIVYEFFHEQIESVIYATLKELNEDNIEVVCEDKGAYDCTIRARLITAIERMRGQK